MDPTRFDALARTLVAATSRRGVVGLLLGGGLAALAPNAGAKKSRKRKSKRGAGSDDRGKNKDKQRKDNERQGKQQRPQSSRAAAASCCSTGNCTPGKGKNLSKCCYQGQNLTGKNFSAANLGSANFSRAALTGANVQAANLDKACLVDADLRGIRANNSTNLGTAIFCRTQTDSGLNDSGCDRGTPCCPTCDAAHPCADGQVCCAGRCIPGDCCDNNQQSTCGEGAICCNNRCADGDCCTAADCPNRTCQRRSCEASQCIYEPVFGQPGPRCQTVCCEDTQDQPVCCDDGIAVCQSSGLCGCGDDGDCAADQRCCRGTCVPRTICCDGDNAEGCAGADHCCQVSGAGVCRACCTADQCPDETCETKSCAANGTCAYTPVFDDPGPGCATVCCENADEQPVCCPDGVTVCTASGRCRCEGSADCAADQICCNGACIANTQCCGGIPNTCPAPTNVCQVRACSSGVCQPLNVSGGSCPLPGGGTGTCNNGSCLCPSPRITCNNVCCIEGVTACAANGTCPQLCDVCASGCTYTTVAAAIAGTAANGTIRICPGTYPTTGVAIDKNLTIIGSGSGAGGTILDGQLTNRIFSIADGVIATIRDLTVTRGRGTQNDNTGAAIRVLFDADLTLNRVEVTDSVNDSGFGLGTIWVAPGSTLRLRQSRVANNSLSSAFGGGITCDDDATVNIEASRIEGNTAGVGGGIWLDNTGVVNLDSASFVTGNVAQAAFRGAGGGIFNKGTVTGVTNSNVFGNVKSNPTAPDNCANAIRDGGGRGVGCPA